MSAADKTEGRSIHLCIDIWLTPPDPVSVGPALPAWEIGGGLLKEATAMLGNSLEAEGFVVKIKTQRVVY